jgi:hypothetical protein
MEEALNIRLSKTIFDIQDNQSMLIDYVSFVQTSKMELPENSVQFEDSFFKNYNLGAEFGINWYENDIISPTSSGKINILPLDKIIKKLSSSNYDSNHYEDDDPIKDFYVVDEFINEAGVGIYAGKHATNSLYYFNIDEQPEYLGLDFVCYLEMAIEAKFFIYWQKAILAIRNGNSNTETEQFKLHMPRLFPGWTWEGFVAKYESLKIEEGAY